MAVKYLASSRLMYLSAEAAIELDFDYGGAFAYLVKMGHMFYKHRGKGEHLMEIYIL
jgi:hypothetical protein